ncbi:MAG: hypothetical protein ACETWT_03050 [Thermodesulfobacteriota bacterium]
MKRFFGLSIECKIIRGEMISALDVQVQADFGETVLHEYVVP